MGEYECNNRFTCQSMNSKDLKNFLVDGGLTVIDPGGLHSAKHSKSE